VVPADLLEPSGGKRKKKKKRVPTPTPCLLIDNLLDISHFYPAKEGREERKGRKKEKSGPSPIPAATGKPPFSEDYLGSEKGGNK